MPENDIQLRDGRIVRSEEPLNLEMPFETVESFITPTESFYVRTHFPIPAIDRDAWWLHVEGEVEKPFAINYEELVSLESLTIPVTLECAGNNRNFLEPKVKGVQWGLGAVGTAEWTGVPLSVLLDRAVVRSNAREVILEGADHGMLDDPKSPPAELTFSRSVPLEKAKRDVLLAYRMNGKDLPLEHGFPVRAIVPGWYAMASIKGCSASSSRTSHSPVIIRPWIMRTGKGEGTSANLLHSPRCSSRRKSPSRLRARLFRKILMFAFTVLPGHATVKSQRSKSAQMAEQHGTQQA
jgi:DMSO/TMAO reductase YedYZ molybdopterin-dependent catalytic subunit